MGAVHAAKSRKISRPLAIGTGLVTKDVETRFDAFLLYCSSQRRLIHDLPAGGVHEYRTRPQGRKYALGNKPAGMLIQGDMDAQYIRTGRHFHRS